MELVRIGAKVVRYAIFQMAEVSEQRIFETNAQGFGDSGRKAGKKNTSYRWNL